jgi:hypothetical protein
LRATSISPATAAKGLRNSLLKYPGEVRPDARSVLQLPLQGANES